MNQPRIPSYCEILERQVDELRATKQMRETLQAVLSWLTNMNTHEPEEIARMIIDALRSAGVPDSELDKAALAMLRGAAHL
jgi:hypothetical protein